MILLDLVIIAFLLLIAGHFKGRLDAIADELVKQADWPNKYDFTKPGYTKHWWYLGLYKPKFPERFPFSTTVLVAFTDRWHMNQLLMLRCFYLALAIALPVGIWTTLLIAFIIAPIFVGLAFEVSYENYRDYISNKKYNHKRGIVDGDEPYDNPQVTSVPEKQIEDEEHGA